MGYLLSIVIPTRNRELYCIEAINNTLSYDDDCFELVIQDNSDSSVLKEFVDKINDSRLKYYRVQGRINSVLNMDQALSKAVGEYVCMIGDDDAILPNIFSVVRWAKENGIKAVTPKLSYGFLWDHDNSLNGRLITHHSSSIIKQLKPEVQLKKLFKNGIIRYDKYDLPRLYHGILRRDVLLKIFEQTGHFIGGLSPDIYLSVASCFYIDKYYKVEFPFTIPGNCVQSASVGRPRSRFQDMPHLWNRGDYKWNNLIPKYNSSQTLWADTALKAIEENADKTKWLNIFNLKYFLTVFWLQNIDRHDEIESELGKIHYVNLFCAIRYYVKILRGRIYSLFNYIKGERKSINGLNSWTGVLECIKQEIIYF